MALTFKSLGKGLTKIAKVAAPVAGFALGPAAGIGLGLASGLGNGKKSLGKMAGGAALGGAGALAGKLAGVSKLGVIGGLKKAGSGLAKIGKSAGGATVDAFKTADGGIDLSKLLGLGLGLSSFKGARDESNAANAFNASNAAMRQKLMERLSQGPDYSALMNKLTQSPNYNFK